MNENSVRADILTRFKSGTDHPFYKHGLYKSRLYGIWSNMKTRCFTKSYKLYPDYGGRGITVCDEWKNSFMNFYNWAMSNGYSDDLSIDRIDNNKGYYPDNCRWADKSTQSKNRRSTKNITYKGITKCLSEWSKELGIDRRTLNTRIYKYGWSIEKAFNTPVNRR